MQQLNLIWMIERQVTILEKERIVVYVFLTKIEDSLPKETNYLMMCPVSLATKFLKSNWRKKKNGKLHIHHTMRAPSSE